MDLAVTAVGLSEAAVEMQEMLTRGAELSPVFQLLADDFRVLEHEQFGTEGARGGEQWAPLLPSTVRSRGGSAHPILRRTALLEESLTKPGAAQAVQDITSVSMTVGTSVAYAGAHQQGTSRMAARPVIALQPTDSVRWAETISRYIAGPL